MAIDWAVEEITSEDDRWEVSYNGGGKYILIDHVLKLETIHSSLAKAIMYAERIDAHPETQKPHLEKVAGRSEPEPPGTGGYDAGNYCP